LLGFSLVHQFPSHVLLHVLFCSPQCSVCLLLLGFLLVLGSSSKERERERERERESYYV
jgi:hypothetical protein